MSAVENGWFREMNEQWLGYSVGLKLEKVLVDEKTKYQHILLFKSTTFGNVLVLDGCIQCTERDECCYQEMITHLPLSCHANPKEVLVVGGGDGGVVREVLKHPGVEKVTLCEIDGRVIEVCKQHLPNMAKSLEDPRVHVEVGDGVEYMKENKGDFDIIITDAPDPIALLESVEGKGQYQQPNKDLATFCMTCKPARWHTCLEEMLNTWLLDEAGAAKGLYEEEYYRCIKEALKPDGIICSQGQDIWVDIENAKDLLDCCRKIFPRTGYAYACMPTYAGGQIGFVLASTNPDIQFDKPIKTYTEEDVQKMGFKFYNSDIHRASFVLPQFAKQFLHAKPVAVENGGGDT